MSGLFRVGILGMGRIAAGFDVPHGAEIKSHMKAILAEPRLVITHVADNNLEHARGEVQRFGLNAKVIASDAILAAPIDALCIATDDGSHIDYVERAAAGSARVVLVEKPLEGNSGRRQAAVAALRARGATLSINHLRRWIPEMAGWITAARAGEFGRPLSVVVHYDRGFRHNGVHAFDLVAAFIGARVTEVRSIAPSFSDFAQEDMTRSLFVMLSTDTGPVPFLLYGCDGRVQSVFSVDLRFERGRIAVFNEDGVRADLYLRSETNEPGFAPELVPTKRFYDSPPRLLAMVWKNIADYLDAKSPLVSADSDVLAGYELADAIMARSSA